MSEKEITRAQFVAVTGLTNPSDTTYSTGTGDPVQQAIWYHALVFCNKTVFASSLSLLGISVSPFISISSF